MSLQTIFEACHYCKKESYILTTLKVFPSKVHIAYLEFRFSIFVLQLSHCQRFHFIHPLSQLIFFHCVKWNLDLVNLVLLLLLNGFLKKHWAVNSKTFAKFFFSYENIFQSSYISTCASRKMPGVEITQPRWLTLRCTLGWNNF